MKIFSKGIFKEALRQTAPYSILLTVFYLIVSLINILETLSVPSQSVFEYVSIASYVPHVSAAVFTLIVFNFVFERKSGDFFGAVNQSKKVKVVSLFTAAIFQAFVPLAVVSVLASVALLMLIPQMFFLGEIFGFLLITFVGCFAFAANTFLGIVVMNRWLSGFVMGMLFMALPAWILELLCSNATKIGIKMIGVIEAENPFFTIINLNNFLNLNCLPYCIFSGIIALWVGYLVFVKKGYEGAGGKIEKNIQMLFSAMCATCVGLISVYALFEQTLMTVIYFFMAFVAVVSDMLCSRTVKTIGRGLITACITMGVVFLLSSICVFEQKLLTKSYIDIKNFSIMADYTGNSVKESIPREFHYRLFKTQKDTNLEKIKIKDKEITEFLENIIKNQPSSYDEGVYRKLTIDVTTPSGAKYNNVSFLILNSDCDKLYDMIYSDEEILQKAYCIEKPSARIRVDGLKSDLTEKEQQEIYKSFYNEYNKLTLEEKINFHNYALSQNYISLIVYRPWGDDVHLTTYKITKQFMPETFEKIRVIGGVENISQVVFY